MAMRPEADGHRDMQSGEITVQPRHRCECRRGHYSSAVNAALTRGRKRIVAQLLETGIEAKALGSTVNRHADSQLHEWRADITGHGSRSHRSHNHQANLLDGQSATVTSAFQPSMASHIEEPPNNEFSVETLSHAVPSIVSQPEICSDGESSRARSCYI